MPNVKNAFITQNKQIIICVINKLLLPLYCQLETICITKKIKKMATKEEWKEYFERLKLRIDIINKSNLDESTKEKLIDELLEKMNIVSKYFYEE